MVKFEIERCEIASNVVRYIGGVSDWYSFKVRDLSVDCEHSSSNIIKVKLYNKEMMNKVDISFNSDKPQEVDLLPLYSYKGYKFKIAGHVHQDGETVLFIVDKFNLTK